MISVILTLLSGTHCHHTTIINNTAMATAGSQLYTQPSQCNCWITAAHTTQPRQPLDHSCTHSTTKATAGSQLHTQHNQGNRWITAAHTTQPRENSYRKNGHLSLFPFQVFTTERDSSRRLVGSRILTSRQPYRVTSGRVPHSQLLQTRSKRSRQETSKKYGSQFLIQHNQ